MTSLHELVIRLSESDLPKSGSRVTAYAVRLANGQWAGDHHHWVDKPEEARSFASKTTALYYAITALGLKLPEFSIELVASKE